MTIQNLNKIAFSFIFILIFTSCDSNDDSESSTDEPVLIEDYYFRGTLDGQELNIERKLYDFNNDPNLISIDFGGSQTNDIEVLGEPGTGFCYGRYACGLLYYNFQENPNQSDTAKMYFSRIPIGDCNLETELISMRNFLEINDYTYETFPGNDIINNVALDFFPVEYENQDIYYSSRFGANTNATFSITSVIEEENGTFIVEGNFSCKLYKFNDETDFKVLENGEFKIKIFNNLEE
nr:hypothetical protein [uncultured Psychroserpens sp.]